MKKLFLFILIILFLSSIYKDLYFGTEISETDKVTGDSVVEKEVDTFNVIKIKIESGDTVLSIVEHLNPELPSLDIDKVLADFGALNPNSDPEMLKVNHFYFFPRYDE